MSAAEAEENPIILSISKTALTAELKGITSDDYLPHAEEEGGMVKIVGQKQ